MQDPGWVEYLDINIIEKISKGIELSEYGNS